MKINTEKSKVISDSTPNLAIENEEIEIIKEFKFFWSLGICQIEKKCMVRQRHLGNVKATSLRCIDTTDCYKWF